MKKILCSLLIALSHLLVWGQIDEDFENWNNLPSGWTGTGIIFPNISHPEGGSLESYQNKEIYCNGDDYLATPAITVRSGVSDYLSFWMRYHTGGTASVKISTSPTPPTGPESFTEPLLSSLALDWNYIRYTVDLSSYLGQTIYIGFFPDNESSFSLDNIKVRENPNCNSAVPSNIRFSSITLDSGSANWNPSSPVPGSGYEYYLTADPTPPNSSTVPTGNTSSNYVSFSYLASSTLYYFYVRARCSGGYSDWSIYNAQFYTLSKPADLPYSTGFEPGETSGWIYISGWYNYFSDWWYGTPPHSGNKTLFTYVSSPSDTNHWLFSRGLNLTGGQAVTVEFYYRNHPTSPSLSEVLPVNLKATIGEGQDEASQTHTLTELTGIINTDYLLSSTDFTPSDTGVYYLGFLPYIPSGNAAGIRYLNLDDVSVKVSTNMSVEELKLLNGSLFRIYPNPVKDLMNIKFSDKFNLLKTTVSITDMNGRLVKTFGYSGSYNVSNLAKGVYLVTVSDGQNRETKKMIKE
jgi:hypothetical protein